MPGGAPLGIRSKSSTAISRASRVAAIASMTSVPPGFSSRAHLGQHPDVVRDVLQDLARHHDVGAVGQRHRQDRRADREHAVLGGGPHRRAGSGRGPAVPEGGGVRGHETAAAGQVHQHGVRTRCRGCVPPATPPASAASRSPRGFPPLVRELVVLRGVVAHLPVLIMALRPPSGGGSWSPRHDRRWCRRSCIRRSACPSPSSAA